MVTKQSLLEERNILRKELMSAQSRSMSARPGAWTPGQALEHILLTEQSVIVLLRRMERKAGQGGPRSAGEPWPVRDDFLKDFGTEVMEEPAFTGTDPTGALSPDQMSSLAEENADALEELIQRADARDLSSASFPHLLIGRMNFYEWLAFLVAHERLHVEYLRNDLV